MKGRRDREIESCASFDLPEGKNCGMMDGVGRLVIRTVVMARFVFVAAIAFGFGAGASVSLGQWIGPPVVGFYGGPGPYGSFSDYGVQAPFGAFGPLSYSNLLFQQQALANQQLLMQQQLALAGQVRSSEQRLTSLDEKKQQLVAQYRAMSSSDKASARVRVMGDYLALDAATKEAWKRDPAMQKILGPDLDRLESMAAIGRMDDGEKQRLREQLLTKFRSLAAEERKVWEKDAVLQLLLGRDWWMR
jgi:hypothetical protein